MKKILILTLIAFGFFEASAQNPTWQQIFGNQRFQTALGIPVRDTITRGSNDTSNIVIRPQDGILYYRRNGWWIRASAQDTSNFVTVAGAAQTITSEKTFRTPLNIIAGASGGATMTFNSTANGGNKWHIGAWSNVNDLPRSFGFYNELSGKTPLVIDTQRLQFINPFQITWTIEDLGYADSGYPNAGMAWDSLNRLQVNNGTAGSYADLKLRNGIFTGLAGTGTRLVVASSNGTLEASSDIPNTTYIDSVVAVERDRAEYVESTKANASDVFQTIVVDYASSGWNASKTQYTFSANLPNYNVFNNTIGRYLLDGEITKTITSFTLADTARSGDVFFVTGALGAPQTITSTANASAERIAKMRSKLQAKSQLGIGLISLTDIGVTQSNPYNLLFWYDGAIVWPLKKVDSLFNPEWKEGGILYIDSLGNKYESISVVRMNDPTLTESKRIYYVQYNGGSDDTTNNGSYAVPFKRLNYANLRAIQVAQRDGLPYEVRILDQWIGTDGGLTGSGLTIPDGVKGKIIGYHSSGSKTRLVGQRENYTDALFNWQYIGFGTWACYSTSINTATKQSAMQFDLLYRDADSAPMPMYYIAPQADSNATISAIQNRPASFGYFTSGGATTMYVHTFDGRKPSVDNWVYDEGISAQTSFFIGEGANMFLENIERYYNVTGVGLAAIRARPINAPFSYLSHTGQFWLYNCGIYGSSGQGFQLYDIQYGGTEWLTCKYTREDAENYHSFNTYAYTPSTMGDYMNLWSNFSIAEHLGENNFRGQPALGESVNAISAHDKVNLISLNSFGGYTHGSVSAQVLGAQVLQMNCHYYFPTQPQSVGPPSGGSPKTPFWVDSDGILPVTKFTVIGCSGNNRRYTNIFSATNSGQLYYFLQNGKTTSETYNSGTITNLNY